MVPVAVKLERGPVKLVGAALRYDVNHGPEVAAVFRREVVGDDLIFLNLILIVDEEIGPTNAQVVVVRPVDLKVIGATTVSVYGKAGAVGVGPPAAVLGDAGNHQRQGVDSAPC